MITLIGLQLEDLVWTVCTRCMCSTEIGEELTPTQLNEHAPPKIFTRYGDQANCVQAISTVLLSYQPVHDGLYFLLPGQALRLPTQLHAPGATKSLGKKLQHGSARASRRLQR